MLSKSTLATTTTKNGCLTIIVTLVTIYGLNFMAYFRTTCMTHRVSLCSSVIALPCGIRPYNAWPYVFDNHWHVRKDTHTHRRMDTDTGTDGRTRHWRGDTHTALLSLPSIYKPMVDSRAWNICHTSENTNYCADQTASHFFSTLTCIEKLRVA